MIVGIHQPHFLPWLGYWNKIARSDAFVWLHTVQFRKNYFQNRTRIKDSAGNAAWLTLPVHAPLGTPIDEITIADPRWRERVWRTLSQCYKQSPYFEVCWERLWEAMNKATDRLEDVNWQLVVATMDLLGLSETQLVRAGALRVETTDPTDRLVAMCKELGASRYLSGRGGHEYLRSEAFERAGIEILWQDFDPERCAYEQGDGQFVPGLSIVDCIFNVGAERAAQIAREAWWPQ